MDNLTHSLFGLTLARTPLGRRGRGATIAIVLASNAPDIDVIATSRGSAMYFQWHRGPTHGPLGVLGLALIVAAIVWAVMRWWETKDVDPPASFRALWAISIVGVLCHVLMDLPTSYGIRLLSPFSWTWVTEDWIPIVDVYLLAILGAGLWFGRSGRSPALRSRNAAIALALMLLNYGVRAAAHHQAIARAPQLFGAQLPERCIDAAPRGSLFDRWPRATTLSPRDRSATRCLMEIAAMPDFLSPFRWRLIAQLSNSYEVRAVDLIADESRVPASNVRLVSVHFPNQWTPAVEHASVSPIAQIFLGFSRFPSVRSVIDADGTATVRWTDVRFDVDVGLGPRERGPRFSATIQLDRDGRILNERLGF